MGVSKRSAEIPLQPAAEETMRSNIPVTAIDRYRYALVLIVLLILPGPAVVAQVPPDNEIQIAIEKIGQVNVVDVSVSVLATPQQAWAVLTDWDNLTNFMTNIKASRIIARSGDTVRVKQTVRAKVWPFSFDIELDREIELFPYERMQFRLLDGDFDKMEGTVRLIADPPVTRILSHIESIPKFWIPPLVGSMIIERETRDQFRQIIDEIARRGETLTTVPNANNSAQ